MRRDPEADVAARVILTRGKIQKANFLSGSKTKGVVVTETVLESIAATGAELDPRVISWTPQPLTIDLRSGETAATKQAMMDRFRGSPHTPRMYTPDFLFKMKCGARVLIECKHTHWLRKDPEKIAFILTALPSFGFRVVLVDERSLRGAYEQNVKLLAPLVNRSVESLDLLVEFCRHPQPFRDVVHQLQLPQADVLTAIAQGHLSCNLRLYRITPHTLLQASGCNSFLWVPGLS